jgi:type II secretory pathway predicted ATPase ExeA
VLDVGGIIAETMRSGGALTVYKQYFGLKEKPFGKTPDPRFLFLSKGHEEALARLEYAVEDREIAF